MIPAQSLKDRIKRRAEESVGRRIDEAVDCAMGDSKCLEKAKAERAAAVVRHLVESAGVSADRLSSRGSGRTSRRPPTTRRKGARATAASNW